MNRIRTILFAGGGSAGHVVPALPLIEHFLGAGWQVHFVGSRSGLEQALIGDTEVTFHGIATGKLRRYFSWRNAADAVNVVRGIAQASRLVRRVRPDVVLSKGGFVSFPVVAAAWLARVPVVAHESDLTPGLANRLAAPFLTSLCVTFEETAERLAGGRLRVVHTGTPVRDALLCGDAARGRALLGLTDARPALVVVGGSLGAERLNTALRGALDELLSETDVVHVCGPSRCEAALATRAGYVQREFVGDGWGDVLAAADLVVSRAGANALYELLRLGKPNLLVPLGRTSSRGDQIDNAAWAARRGLSRVLPETELTPRNLAAAVREMLAELPEWRARLAAFPAVDARQRIVAEILQAAK